MKVKQFKITLQEDVVISERAATEGGHSSLDYLPGATFLGAVAAHLYKKLSNENAYRLFHSGKVRFGNALPLSEENQLTYPMPFCWYKKKGEKYNGKMALINYQWGKYPSKEVPEQMRNDYISLGAFEENNRFTKINPRFRMKTAIDSEFGTAKNRQLFGYSSLPAGQQFIFNIEADDEIEPNLFEQIITILQNEQLKLGRSRSAEYGAINLELYEPLKDERGLPKATSEVTLWLLADAALQDKFGQPSLLPTANNIGLPSHFEFDSEKSFIRSRCYAPFNAYYRRRELERLVLSMGSVLHFNSQEAIDEKILKSLQNQGIGLYRQAGLGRVWINPPLLATKSPKFGTLKRPPQEETFQLETPNHPVFRYLNKRVEQTAETKIIETQANEWENELKNLYKSARKISSTAVFGPSKTQWGTVMEIAKNAISAETLVEKLFVGEHAVCKETDKKTDLEWSQRIFDDKNPDIDNFRKWLKNKIETEKQRELLPQIVARFALLARRVVDKQSKEQSVTGNE